MLNLLVMAFARLSDIGTIHCRRRQQYLSNSLTRTGNTFLDTCSLCPLNAPGKNFDTIFVMLLITITGSLVFLLEFSEATLLFSLVRPSSYLISPME